MTIPEGISESAWTAALDLVMNSEAERVPYYAMGDELKEARMADAKAIALAIQAAQEAERAAIIDRLWKSKDLDGSTGDEYDNGYVDAFNDAIRAVRKGA